MRCNCSWVHFILLISNINHIFDMILANAYDKTHLFSKLSFNYTYTYIYANHQEKRDHLHLCDHLSLNYTYAYAYCI